MAAPAKLIALFFLSAAAIRAIDVHRPVDGTVRQRWRECDMAEIARNFYREGMNPLYPRIAWRKDGPGFTESELPILPWLTAIGYKVLGFHEEIGRWIVYLFGLAGSLAFFWFSFHTLPFVPACGAAAFWTVHPLLYSTATTLQPETILVTFSVVAVALFHQWLTTERNFLLWASMIFASLAIMTKSPGAYVGLVMGALWFEKTGFKCLRDVRLWLFAAGSLLPPFLWYFHAHSLWTEYGNSLGISNEYHWVGLDFLTDGSFAKGILEIDLDSAWTYPGALVALLGMVLSFRSLAGRLAFYWVFSTYVFYVLAARTTSEEWASYYHILVIPGAAMLFGLGLSWMRLALDSSSPRRWIHRLLGVTVLAGGLLAGLELARHLKWQFHPRRFQDLYECGVELGKKIPGNPLIVVSADRSVDDKGYPVAHDNSYFFYWMDKKGFTLAADEQSPERLEDLQRRGARFFVAEETHLKQAPEFEAYLRQEYKVVGECAGVALLFRLE